MSGSTKRNPDDDKWLLDAEVLHRVTKNKGEWDVELLFIDVNDPLHFLCKKINTYRSEKLANIAANIMQQNAEKDQRGTQKVKKDAINIHKN